MAGDKRSSSSKPQKSQKAKKHQRLLTSAFGAGGDIENEVAALNKLHGGKRLLIPARGVYENESDIPPAETNFLFVYSLRKINPDGQTASIDFESKYIEDGGSQWVNYADTAAEDAAIDSEHKSITTIRRTSRKTTRDTTPTSAK